MQIHLHNEDLGTILSQLKSLKVGWVKVQVSWKLYEPEPGQYDQNLLRELDLLVSSASAEEIDLLLSVAKAPEWSRPTTELDGPPADYALYGDFMRHIARRYQGNVAAYELWNEANLRREWNGVMLSATDFVSLIRAGANGVREADPMAIVISGAPAPTGIHDYVDAIDDRVFYGKMMAAGLADLVDAVGAHAYGWANPPDTSANAPDPTVSSHNDHPKFLLPSTLWDYAAILLEFGYPEKLIWVTEFGWGKFRWHCR